MAFPLSFGNCVVGFCGVDGFESVPRGRDDDLQPEHGIREYIGESCKLLGKALFEQRMADVLSSFSKLTQDFNLTPEIIIKTVVDSITKHVLFSLSIDVYEVHPELSETQRELRRSLKMSRTERRSIDKPVTRKNRRSLNKAMAVAAALESSLIQARLEAKKKDPEKEAEERMNSQRMNNKSNAAIQGPGGSNKNEDEEALKPQLGMIRRRAGWGGTTLMEYSLKVRKGASKKCTAPYEVILFCKDAKNRHITTSPKIISATRLFLSAYC